MEVMLQSPNGVCDAELGESVRVGLASLRALVDAVTHFVAMDETEQRVFPYLDALKKARNLTDCAQLLPEPPLGEWLRGESQLLTEQENKLRSLAGLDKSAEHAALLELRNAIDAQNASINECTKLGIATLHSTAAVDSDSADHINCERLRHLAQEHARVLGNSVDELKAAPSGALALAALYRAARCRQAIRALVEEDDLQIRRINRWLRVYGLVVAGFVAVLTLAATGAAYFLQVDLAAAAMTKTPVLMVPVAVLIWSFLGAVCATLYNFNIHPSSESSNFVKWLVTRPLVGLVFGAVTYFVLDSGLMAIRGDGSLTSSAGVIVVCYLAAFSDRFALVIFRALIPSEWRSRTDDNRRGREHHASLRADANSTAV